MRICRVLQLPIVFKGFGKLRSPVCIFRNLFHDFQTWEGLGGWLAVNLGFGSVSLVVGTLAETWFFRRDAEDFLRREASQKSKAE